MYYIKWEIVNNNNKIFDSVHILYIMHEMFYFFFVDFIAFILHVCSQIGHINEK